MLPPNPPPLRRQLNVAYPPHAHMQCLGQSTASLREAITLAESFNLSMIETIKNIGQFLRSRQFKYIKYSSTREEISELFCPYAYFGFI